MKISELYDICQQIQEKSEDYVQVTMKANLNKEYGFEWSVMIFGWSKDGDKKVADLIYEIYPLKGSDFMKDLTYLAENGVKK